MLGASAFHAYNTFALGEAMPDDGPRCGPSRRRKAPNGFDAEMTDASTALSGSVRDVSSPFSARHAAVGLS
jgi:hypothetical protein